MDEAIKISAIVVSYNTRRLTLDCLRALTEGLAGIPSEILVVDNASADGSAGAIRAEFPNVRVIENTVNQGFGAANNQAMRVSCGEFLLLMNSDAFPKPGAIAALVEYMEAHPEAGVVGPKLLFADGADQRSCFRFPSPWHTWLENLWLSRYRNRSHDIERNVDFVIGACMLARRSVFEQVGGFDEDFFLYCEEADWQKRIRSAGWEVLFTPAARVTHLAGASGSAEPARVNRNFYAGLDVYQIKHHGWVGLILFRLAMIVGCALRAPLWAGRWALGPGRAAARAKLKLRLWLIWRQATYWRINFGRP